MQVCVCGKTPTVGFKGLLVGLKEGCAFLYISYCTCTTCPARLPSSFIQHNSSCCCCWIYYSHSHQLFLTTSSVLTTTTTSPCQTHIINIIHTKARVSARAQLCVCVCVCRGYDGVWYPCRDVCFNFYTIHKCSMFLALYEPY